eukprot:CAMPEP_0178743002 /NCGR_PEP_ID=MMETSP0744-20121128/5977_1 /TAXON_ID=913974 /ORGANISM="Nitzschia punctata, Strain CCMP561" /LENGTH=257 /DNA_ID=CAMNT_0020395985 /DNA_START=60 /DNA_END=833 /DNA_ORIENTATION=+
MPLEVSTPLTQAPTFDGLQHSLVNYIDYMGLLLSGMYILTTTILLVANRNRDAGVDGFLSRNRERIWIHLRNLSVLLSLLLIPMLVVYSNPQSGYQEFHTWLWGLIGGLLAALFLGLIYLDCRSKRMDHMEEKDETTIKPLDTMESSDEVAVDGLAGKVFIDLSTDELATWVVHSKSAFQMYSSLTDSELNVIANKLREAEVDGRALVSLLEANNDDWLIKYAGLTVGKAMKFVSAIRKIEEQGVSLADFRILEQND